MSEENAQKSNKKMTDYQRRGCLKVIDELLQMSISKPFSKPVNPKRDLCPDYFEYIQRPMDLGTIRKKLLKNEYESTDHFKVDVRTVWENCYKYHGNDLISKLAKQLQQEYEGMTAFLTGDDLADWVSESEWLKSKMEIKIYGNQMIQFLKGEISFNEINHQNEIGGRKLKELNKTELRKFAKELNKMTDEVKISEAIKFIENEDPSFVVNNEVDMDLEELSDHAVALLRKKLKSI